MNYKERIEMVQHISNQYFCPMINDKCKGNDCVCFAIQEYEDMWKIRCQNMALHKSEKTLGRFPIDK